MSFWQKYNSIILAVVSALFYFIFASFLERTEFYKLLLLWIGLFTTSYFLFQYKKSNFYFLASIAILFRLVFIFSIPNLSQDFYRFIWDGRMILEGFNPYLHLPKSLIEQRKLLIPQSIELYQGMGIMNGSHFTNYPPINQFCFLIAAIFANKSIIGSVVVMRVIIILADIGVIYYGKKLLETLKLPVHNIFFYALNPFIIIEMTGNLHFEPVMLFFLVWGLYKLQQQKWVLAAILIACSISVKLIPLLFLPLFFQWFLKNNLNKNYSFKIRTLKLVSFNVLIFTAIIVFFLPFYTPQLISNYTNSVGLWFKNFEFNASFYYIVREIGYLFRGYNEIATIGKITPILTIIFLIVITFFRKNKSLLQLITAMLFGLSFYYFTTTTMHPWYIATLLVLSVFTKYRFPIIWSFVIILSYQAYANKPWKENLWFVGLEYSIVYGFLIWELFIKKPIQKIEWEKLL